MITKNKEAVAIVGAGIGGLTAAIRLAGAGYTVTVFEKNAQPGGKCNRISHDGFHFDTGPSLLTLPDVLQRVFVDAGRNPADYLDLVRLTPACRYFFPDGLSVDAPGSMAGFRQMVNDYFPADLKGFDRFMRHAGTIWQVSSRVFLFAPFSVGTILRTNPLLLLRSLTALRPGSMQSAIHSYFKSPHLRQIFLRYATYNGSHPARTPATFNVIPFAELSEGSWHCRGGMYAIVEALVRLGGELGVHYAMDTPVARVRFNGTAVAGLDLENGSCFDCSKVIINADAIAARSGALLKNHPHHGRWCARYARAEPSVSGYVMLLALGRQYPDLACHNVFFCKDYGQEFADIFDRQAPLSDPTIYVSIPARVDDSQAPEGKEGWFVLVNAPSLKRCRQWSDGYGDSVLNLLGQRFPGFEPSSVLWRRDLSPRFLEEQYNAWHGTIYGTSSNSFGQAFFRVPNRASTLGLYFAGGSAPRAAESRSLFPAG